MSESVLCDKGLENKPYILCPDLSSLDIKTTPIWVCTKKQTEGIPCLLLESVPDAYFQTLEANGFAEFHAGWVVAAASKNERFWRKIFSDQIGFAKRKPDMIVKSNSNLALPPPHSVITLIKNLSDEHIEWMSKNTRIVGFSALRLAKKKAIAGSLSNEGVFDIIKLCCLERLEMSPDDTSVLTYLWEVVAAGPFSSKGIPREIEPKRLLMKACERKRVTAGIEEALPPLLRAYTKGGEWAMIDWGNSAICLAEEGGLLPEAHFFKTKLSLVNYLLDNSIYYRIDPTVDTDKHVSACKNHIADNLPDDHAGPGWIDDIELPGELLNDENGDVLAATDVDLSNPSPVPAVSNIIAEYDAIADDLMSWGETTGRLNKIWRQIEALTEPARFYVLKCCEVFVDSPGSKLHSARAQHGLELFVRLFHNCVTTKHVSKVIDDKKDLLNQIARRLSDDNRSLYARLMKLFRDASYVESLIDSGIGEETDGWYAKGFRIMPLSDEKWAIYQNKGVDGIQQFYHGTFSSYRSANQMLRHLVQKSCLQPARRSFDAGWMTGYAGTHDSIALLSQGEHKNEGSAVHHINSNLERFLNEPKLYPYLISSPPKFSDIDPNFQSSVEKICRIKDGNQSHIQRIAGALLAIEEIFDLEAGYSLMSGSLSITCWTNRWQFFYQGDLVYSGLPDGLFLFAWSKAYYEHFKRGFCSVESREALLTLFYTHASVVPDFSQQENIIDRIHSNEILADVAGDEGVEKLTLAVESPCAEHYAWVREIYLNLKSKEQDHILLPLIHDALIISHQFGTRRKLSATMRNAMRCNLNDSDVFAGAMSFVVWNYCRWNNKNKDYRWLAGGGIASHQPSFNVFPERFDWSSINLAAKVMAASVL